MVSVMCSVLICRQVEKGEIHHEDYNHVICTLDMLVEVATIRKHLKDFFPNKAKGTVHSDMRVVSTVDCVSYSRVQSLGQSLKCLKFVALGYNSTKVEWTAYCRAIHFFKRYSLITK